MLISSSVRLHFCRAMLCISAAYAVMRSLTNWPFSQPQLPRANRSVTSAYTWTATCQWTSTSRNSPVRVSAFCVNFVASVVRCHVQHWWPCNVVLAALYHNVIWTVCTAVGRQRSCSPVSRRSQIPPSNTVAEGPSLAAGAWACEVKLCVLMHRCLTGAAPRYLTELAVPVASTARCYLLVVLCLQLAVQPPVTVRSLLPVHERGTAYHSNIYTIIRHF